MRVGLIFFETSGKDAIEAAINLDLGEDTSVAGSPMPNNNNNNNKNDKDNKNNKDKVKELSDEVPDEYKQNYKCDKYAESLETKMKNSNISGQKIEVTPKTNKGIIYSDEFGEIGNNGFHQGIKVDDTIFDNLHPNGINYYEWMEDLGGEMYNFFKVIVQW